VPLECRREGKVPDEWPEGNEKSLLLSWRSRKVVTFINRLTD
jgi:hypothetical protein